MKKLFYSLFAIMAFIACSDSGPDDGGGNSNNDQPKAPEITLDATAANFTTEGGSTIVTFTSSDAWTAEAINDRADSWCSVSPTSGSAGNGKITITATANDTTDDRTATIVIKSGTTQKTIAVSQKQKNALTVTSSKFEVSADGGEVAIEVKANIDFEYAIEESAKDWVTYQTTRAMKTSTVVFNVAKSEDVEKREAKITIKSGEFNEVVTIYQEGATPAIILTQNEYSVPSAGETIAVEVNSNVDVTVEIPKDIAWITENTTRGVSTNTYYFDIAPNEEYDARKAEIKFINKENNLSEIISITQAQKDAIVIAEDSYTVSGNSDEIEIEVGHNIEFDVTIDGDWITQKETRALETSNLIFIVAENNTGAERSGSITFTSLDNSMQQTITIVQAVPLIAKMSVTLTSSFYQNTLHSHIAETFGTNVTSIKQEGEEYIITFAPDFTSIPQDAFYECEWLNSVRIIDNIFIVEQRAFAYCENLTSVIIGDCVRELKSGPTDKYWLGGNNFRTIGAFTMCRHLSNVVLGKDLITIGPTTFLDCDSISELTIPDNVEYIGDWAFADIRLLKNINIGRNVSTIGNRAFSRCENLSSITIPDNVRVIGDYAFSGCKIPNITIGKGVVSIGDHAFWGCSLKDVTIPDNVTTIGDGAFGNCASLKTAHIGVGVSSIKSNPFYNCDNLTAFYGEFISNDNRCLILDGRLCSFAYNGLTSYVIPDNVTSIGCYAFASSSLESIIFPENIVSIGESAFDFCLYLSSITIPEKVVSIGSYAFRHCESLTSITIPKGVTSIGDGIIERCDNIKEVYCKPIIPPSIGKVAFYFDTSFSLSGSPAGDILTKIYVPVASLQAYINHTDWVYHKHRVVGYYF